LERKTKHLTAMAIPTKHFFRQKHRFAIKLGHFIINAFISISNNHSSLAERKQRKQSLNLATSQ